MTMRGEKGLRAATTTRSSSQPLLQHRGEAAGEGGRVGQGLAFEYACLVEKQPGEIAERLRGPFLARHRRKPCDERMARIDLENALGRCCELLVLLQEAFQMHVEVAVVGDETDSAVGEAVRAAHVLHRIAKR